MKKNIFLHFLIVCTLFIPFSCLADTEKEIQHLLQFVEDSQCVFIRNDVHHSSVKAKQHLAKKYNYIRKRVEKAEDFIHYAATKSSMSGKMYTVICEGLELHSSTWLQTELRRYRQNGMSDKVN